MLCPVTRRNLQLKEVGSNPSIERTATGLAREAPQVIVPLHGPIRQPPLMSNVRQQRVRLLPRHHRCAAMGREVTASSTSRCPVASDALVRFVLALGPVPARLDEPTLVVRYRPTAPPDRLRTSFSKSVPARQPRAPCGTACHSKSPGLLAWQHRALVRCVLPNWSVERTSTGMALGPRSARCHHPLRGPSAIPAPAPHLKR